MNEAKKLLTHDSVINIDQLSIGGGKKIIIAGPCAIESEKQIRQTAALLKKLNVPIMRGGAFKLRTSINSYQGMGKDGLALMVSVCKEFGLQVVSEIIDPRDIELFLNLGVDIIQIGTRNMLNYPLLKEIGKTDTPVFLKRGFMSTVREMILASEYILSGGNTRIIFCERGIRTFETDTRCTLDLSCVPIVKSTISAPVIVDLSHSLGRTDIMLPMAKAALASGSDGLMIEIHPDPQMAKSDGNQSMSFSDFEKFINDLSPIITFLEK